jgi:two-component system, OmpR family, KDP operon response regulator KdpE
MAAMQGEFHGKKILLIEDDTNLRQALALLFERAGAAVYSAADGRSGLQEFFSRRPDLVVLDIKLPDVSGLEVCRQIRLFSHTPILILTSCAQNEDVVRGLDLGADDYLTKPFDMDVLLARSRAVIRRATVAPQRETSAYSDGYLTLDFSKRRIVVDGEQVKLTATEFQLLSYLVRNAGRVLTYRQILDYVWGRERAGSEEYVHLYIYYLRKKLEPDPRQPKYLLTEHGVGYRFERPPG